MLARGLTFPRHSNEFHIYHYFTSHQTFSCQCKDGFGGDGEECEIDPDLDGIPSVGLSCTLPNCFKVRNIQYLNMTKLRAAQLELIGQLLELNKLK